MLKQALTQALQGQEINGQVQGTTDDGNTYTGLYISVPLRNGVQANGQIIGAMLLAEPGSYPKGFLPIIFLIMSTRPILFPAWRFVMQDWFSTPFLGET